MQDSETDPIYPRLRYRYTTGSGPRREPEDYMIDFDVKIVGEYHLHDDPRPSREIHLGDLRATLIRVGRAYEEGFPLYELFDHSQEIDDFASALFETGYEEFVEPITSLFPNAFPHQDLLYIHWLTVQPIARGQRVGVSALHRFMTDWESNCSLIAIQPRPMQFYPHIREQQDWETLALDSFPKSRKEAAATLENHFRGVGFHRVGSLPYMLMCPANRQAPLQEMALEDSMTLSPDHLEGSP